MDPTACLVEIRELRVALLEEREITDVDDVMNLMRQASRLPELIEALDEWISGGGSLPQQWQRPLPAED
jgi:hypothetical protein